MEYFGNIWIVIFENEILINFWIIITKYCTGNNFFMANERAAPLELCSPVVNIKCSYVQIISRFWYGYYWLVSFVSGRPFLVTSEICPGTRMISYKNYINLCNSVFYFSWRVFLRDEFSCSWIFSDRQVWCLSSNLNALSITFIRPTNSFVHFRTLTFLAGNEIEERRSALSEWYVRPRSNLP